MSKKRKLDPPVPEMLIEFDSNLSIDDLGLEEELTTDPDNVRVRLLIIYDPDEPPDGDEPWGIIFEFEALGKDRLGHPTWHPIDTGSPDAGIGVNEEHDLRHCCLMNHAMLAAFKRWKYVER